LKELGEENWSNTNNLDISVQSKLGNNEGGQMFSSQNNVHVCTFVGD